MPKIILFNKPFHVLTQFRPDGARPTLAQYITNNYLGPRNYTDPDDGLEKYTVGYEILTKPEDILDLSDADRDARKSAAIRIRIFRAGAIHQVPVDVDVY